VILLLDNFDSFTCNLADYFLQLGIDCEIKRNNCPLEEIITKDYKAIVISPGPGTPYDSGILMDIISHYHDKIPMLGICLGHQALGIYFGAKLKKAILPKHGKISSMTCQHDPIFTGLPEQFNVTRYHSLVIDELPEYLTTLASTADGEIMAFRHNHLPIYGLQYHPEAILTEFGKEILKNWFFCTK